MRWTDRVSPGVVLASLAFYLALTAGSGTLVLWSAAEIAAGVVLSIGVGALAGKTIRRQGLNKIRLHKLAIYLVYPFFWELVKSNIDVAIRVITGDIRPGIVKIPSRQTSDVGTAILANSITLTPGTLTVDAKGKNLFVHWINVCNKRPCTEDVCGKMADKVGALTK